MATIKHKSDGIEPTTIFSVVPGDATNNQNLPPSQCDQIVEGVLPGWADYTHINENPLG